MPFPGDSAPESEQEKSMPAYPVDFLPYGRTPLIRHGLRRDTFPQWEGVGEHVKTARPAAGAVPDARAGRGFTFPGSGRFSRPASR